MRLSFDMPSVQTFIAAILFSSRWNLIMFVSFSQLNFTFKIKAQGLGIVINNFSPHPSSLFWSTVLFTYDRKINCYKWLLQSVFSYLLRLRKYKLYYVFLAHSAGLHVSLVVTKNGIGGVVFLTWGGGQDVSVKLPSTLLEKTVVAAVSVCRCSPRNKIKEACWLKYFRIVNLRFWLWGGGEELCYIRH